MGQSGTCLEGAFERHAKDFAEHIIKDGLLDESLGNVGTKTDDGILGFAKVFEDPKDGDGVALGVVTVDEMYEKFIVI